MTRPWLLLIPLAAACYSEEEYQADFNQETCAWYDHCDLMDVLGFDGVDDCVSELDASNAEAIEAGEDQCIDYDASAAKECIDGLPAVSCEDRTGTYPAACAQVCADPEG